MRSRHKLELTDAGRVFYLRAKEICRAEEKLHDEIHNKKTAFSELLKLSIPAGNSAYFLHHLFDGFRAEYPNVSFDFYEIPSDFAIPNVLSPCDGDRAGAVQSAWTRRSGGLSI